MTGGTGHRISAKALHASRQAVYHLGSHLEKPVQHTLTVTQTSRVAYCIPTVYYKGETGEREGVLQVELYPTSRET